MEHYINNKVFLEQLNDYKEKIKSAEDDGREIPPIPDDIAISFMKIANGLGNKPNFSNYTYKDEMISDGIENCIQYCRNFDSNKSPAWEIKEKIRVKKNISKKLPFL